MSDPVTTRPAICLNMIVRRPIDYLETMTGAARYWRDVLIAGRDGSSFLTQFAIPVIG